MVQSSAQTSIEFEPTWLDNVHVNLYANTELAKTLSNRGSVTTRANRLQWAIKALQLTDLTTLSGDDTQSNVERLCRRAVVPFPIRIQKHFAADALQQIHTAAVCVYPSRVKDAHSILSRMNQSEIIPIAAVATGFPSGQYALESRLSEITYAIENGATEIDIVLNRTLVLLHKWHELYDEVVAMRRACGQTVHMKTILAIGECGSMENVYRAAMVCMMAGADFIKTSTGKESVNATLPIGLVMINAIRDFRIRTGRQIGLKPAGGVRTVTDAIAWMTMIKATLGDEWLQPHLFRFGASGLLDDIESVVTDILMKM